MKLLKSLTIVLCSIMILSAGCASGTKRSVRGEVVETYPDVSECVEACDAVIEAKDKEIEAYREALEGCDTRSNTCAEERAKLEKKLRSPIRHPLVSGGIGAGIGALLVLILVIAI